MKWFAQQSEPPLGISQISIIVELLFFTVEQIESNSSEWKVKFLPTTIFTSILTMQIAWLMLASCRHALVDPYVRLYRQCNGCRTKWDNLVERGGSQFHGFAKSLLTFCYAPTFPAFMRRIQRGRKNRLSWNCFKLFRLAVRFRHFNLGDCYLLSRNYCDSVSLAWQE